MPILLQTSILLVLSNVFMTFAWYGHLKNLRGSAWFVAALVSWGIALFEYLLQVPANRIGASAYTVPQLKILQEVITLVVFVPFVDRVHRVCTAESVQPFDKQEGTPWYVPRSNFR